MTSHPRGRGAIMQDTLEVMALIKGVQYVVDSSGEKTAVVIDLRKNGELWEDFYDRALAESRREEPRESFESVKTRLAKRRRRSRA